MLLDEFSWSSVEVSGSPVARRSSAASARSVGQSRQVGQGMGGVVARALGVGEELATDPEHEHGVVALEGGEDVAVGLERGQPG